MCVQNNLSLNADNIPTTTNKTPAETPKTRGKFILGNSLYLTINAPNNNMLIARIIYYINFIRFYFIKINQIIFYSIR